MSCCGKSPTLTSMAKDVSNTAINAIRMAIKTGEILAQDDVIKRRITICNSNECGYKRGVKCQKCGCFLSLKTAVAAATCPIGKW